MPKLTLAQNQQLTFIDWTLLESIECKTYLTSPALYTVAAKVASVSRTGLDVCDSTFHTESQNPDPVSCSPPGSDK